MMINFAFMREREPTKLTANGIGEKQWNNLTTQKRQKLSNCRADHAYKLEQYKESVYD